jgi:hypothetical protein
MSKKLVQKFERAKERYAVAQQRLADATAAAFPLGAAVVSYARKHPIYGTVAGYGRPWCDPDSILVKNDRTGKLHRTWPGPQWNGRPGAELL